MKKLLLTLKLAAALSLSAMANEITVSDNSGTGTGTVTWTNDNVYILDGFVFVNDGDVLTIEPGTVIKGKPGIGDNASALIVAKGAKIMAVGTAEEPIIFTALDDEPNTVDELDVDERGLWGGLIVLGDASIAFATPETNIEGIPVTEARGKFGGSNDTDNSGVIKYVSVRHGGSNIGADNEINGITFGGVGSGTVVDHVEVIANKDDGLEFFGGTVSVRHAVVAYCGDDSYDYDFGWRGNGQFWLTIQDPNSIGEDGNRGGEHDGAKPDDAAPFAIPHIYNATYIGNGLERLITMRDGAGGKYYNSVFHNWSKGIDIENTGTLAVPKGAKARLDAGDLIISNNIFSDISAGTTFDKLFIEVDKDAENNIATLEAHPSLANNTVKTLGLSSTNPILSTDEGAGVTPSIPWFDKVTYKGAFPYKATKNWASWTRTNDVLTWTPTPTTEVVVTDNSGAGTGTVTWTKDKVYILDGFVFVNDGDVLTIEPGTIIKGKGGIGDNASALIVARGAKIFAEGTKAEPIIFTSIDDEPNTPDELDLDERGLWGGLIVLGDATIAFATPETNIEGIPVTEARGKFGGSNDADNSGVIKYVSVRHGGSNIGADNEINGITFGGVGSGTVVEHVEVISNKDDGIEFFGGTVSVKWAAVAYCGDDSYDYDFGWRGNGQFWFTVQDPNSIGEDGNRGGEHDGAKPDDAAPFAIPHIYNATYIGNGLERLITMRDGAGGKYYNSIFHNWSKGIDIENTGTLAEPKGAKARLDAGDLVISHNIFSEISAGTTFDKLFIEVDKDAENNIATLEAHPSLANNTVQSLDLSPTVVVPGESLANGVTPSIAWFTKVSYKGAFEHGQCNTWLSDWTRISEVLNACPVATQDVATASNSIVTFPNPTSGIVNFENVTDQKVEIYNMSGSLILASKIENGQLNLANTEAGIYFVKVSKDNVTTAVKIIVE